MVVQYNVCKHKSQNTLAGKQDPITITITTQSPVRTGLSLSHMIPFHGLFVLKQTPVPLTND